MTVTSLQVQLLQVSNVDTSYNVGSYTLTYDVTDANGNAAPTMLQERLMLLMHFL